MIPSLFRITVVVAALSLMSAHTGVLNAKIVKIDTPETSLVLDASKGKKLKHLYYGGKVSDSDAAELKKPELPTAMHTRPTE